MYLSETVRVALLWRWSLEVPRFRCYPTHYCSVTRGQRGPIQIAQLRLGDIVSYHLHLQHSTLLKPSPLRSAATNGVSGPIICN